LAVKYELAEEIITPRFFGSVDGNYGEGKTHFALSLPKPLAIHSFDPKGVGRAIGDYSGQEIYSFKYSMPHSTALPENPFAIMADAAKPIWLEFVKNFRASLKDMKSVVIDHGDAPWTVLRLARLGKLTQILPVQYTAVNAEFRQLIQEATDHDAHVCFIHKLKAEWGKDNQPTGKFERSGFSDIGYDMDVVLRTSTDPKGVGINRFQMTVEKGGNNFAAVGQKLTGADCNFEAVMKLIYPEKK